MGFSAEYNKIGKGTTSVVPHLRLKRELGFSRPLAHSIFFVDIEHINQIQDDPGNLTVSFD